MVQTSIEKALTFVVGDFTNNFEDPNKQALSNWLQQMEALRRTDYDQARAYYGGDHPVRLTDRLRKFLGSEMKFRDNYMEVVVDALAERLAITAFATNEEGGEDGEAPKPVSAWAWDTWQANRMDEVHSIIHTDAIMLGDAYILVDWDNEKGQVRFTPQTAETIIPHYDELTGKIDFLSKKWVESKGDFGTDTQTRLNLYYTDRVEKYRAEGNKWVQYRDEGETAWPQVWNDKAGAPLGVAILHFRNKPAGGSFGVSELANCIHLQDMLNKTLVDIAIQNDNAGFGRAWALDVSLDQSNMDMLPGALFNLKSDDEGGGSLGTIPADDPDGPLKTLEMLVQHIAGTTRTPQYLFQIMGGAPSGEALKTAESGLVKKVASRQVTFGNVWADAMALALRIQNTFGESIGELTERFDVEWQDPETRNEEAHLNALKSKADLGIPQEQLWEEMGYDQETIQRMIEQQKAEQQRQRNIGSALLREFDAGLEEGEISPDGLGPETP